MGDHGEFRRGSYWGRFVERTEGLEVRAALLKFRDDHGHEVDFTAPYATAPLRRAHPLALDEFLFLRDAATEQYQNVKDSATEYYEAGRDKAMEWESQIEDYVRERPIKSLLMAAGVGALLGIIWKRL